ncbi:probable WRKY transcription factor 43 [Diospyros lotus]|uniref:probable WRKY transcription factor 43 n=1 Tax=Diospyros lotus TaxID=55363 RepID=UPI00224DE571|nr:probable WRKY transcription factor 43 [Diospyros lotus]
MAEDDHSYPNLNHLHHLFTPSLNPLSSSPLLLTPQLPLLPNIQDQSVPDQTAAAPDVTIDWDGAGLLVANAIDQKETPLPSSSSSKLGRGLAKKKALNPPRIAFHTRSSEDVLDDGYRWRKYGQKAVKNSLHPRSYYRCTHHTCNVKKQIQRLSKDTSIVVTTYEGIHNHPCEKLMETLGPLLKQIQFLSGF